jgi:hypothetical protein
MESSPNSPHEVAVQAVIAILATLYQHTTQGGADAPQVLRFEVSDSELRYALFCLSAVHVACAPHMTNVDAVLNDLARTVLAGSLAGCGKTGDEGHSALPERGDHSEDAASSTT